MNPQLTQRRLLTGVFAFACLTSVQAQSPDTLVMQALQSNRQLAAQHEAVQASLSGLDEARAKYYPTLGVNARYTRSEGGRTIDIPTGDALNPVYATLNALTAGSAQPTRFPSIDNQKIKLLRPREQDSRLTVSAPLYVPALDAQVNAREAMLTVAQSTREVVARQLVRDVKVAYWALAQASAQQDVLKQSEKVLLENKRIAQVLFDNGKATRDQVLRAQAEVLAIELQLKQVQNSQIQAQRYLNVLRNAQPDDRVDRVATLDAPVSMKAAGSESSATNGASLAAPNPAAQASSNKRPEIKQLEGQLMLLKASEKSSLATYKPTVVIAADAGYQGVNYSTSNPGSGVATASVVLNWTLADFGGRNAQVSKVRYEQKQLENQLAYARQQLDIAVLGAADNLSTAEQSVQTADSRVKAAEESFRIASRKRDEGVLSQVEFFDAERALTEARQSAVIARFQYQTSAAELEFASASYPLNDQYLASDASQSR